jgi:hypothetical protein
MTRHTNTKSKKSRIAAVVAALALAGVLSGCVIAPAPGFYGYYGPHYHGGYWR